MNAELRPAPPAPASVGPWHALAELARLAPTPHNTQPFRLRPLSAHLAQLLILRERMLPVEDTGNLYVLCSFGIFAETLERAGRHLGLDLRVVPDECIEPAAIEPGVGPVALGRVEIRGRCAPEEQRSILEARRTSRLPYEDRLVDGRALQELASVAAAHGHRFECFDDPLIVREVLERNVQALLENNLKPGELAELRRWVRLAGTPATGDGLWPEPMNQPRWEMRLALRYPRLFLLPGVATLARAKYLRTQAGTRHVAILRGPFASWPQLIAAGRMLMQLWLAMTRHKLYMLPFGSMITNSACNRYLRERFGGEDIWFILRFGYSAPPPQAPRLASVVLGEDGTEDLQRCGRV
ncbi:MAG TPA: hypothetical protein VMT66_18255 [Steroidobacteraceae bacterium]|nr:hypothetical protein [Steroidobacteraceae bacterium]